jgi:Predicted pseudouridylate synthase
VKTLRGISQKQKSCINCNGRGCKTCLFHGISEFDSVEGIISQYIFKKFGGTTTKFTWIGGEDNSSLILGDGRPFFVKLQHPNKRKSKLTSTDLNSVKLKNLKIIDKFPKNLSHLVHLLKLKFLLKILLTHNISEN